jgi:hypothetical protein
MLEKIFRILKMAPFWGVNNISSYADNARLAGLRKIAESRLFVVVMTTKMQI